MDGASEIETLKFNLSDLNEDMLHTILELVSDGIWDWNRETEQVFFSPRWKDQLGYRDDELPNIQDSFFERQSSCTIRRSH